MKGRKILLSVVFIIIAIMLIFSTKAFAATSSWKLGAVKVREGINTIGGAEESHSNRNPNPYSYQMSIGGGENQKPVLKIVDKTTGAADFTNAIYCLKAGQGFGSNNDTISDVTYNTYYDMVTEKTQVNSILNLSDENYSSILWLLDNIYLPKMELKERQAYKYTLLGKAFASEFSNFESDFYESTVQDLIITDDDIEVVQQWAIWHFTNPDSEYDTDTLPNIFVNTTGTGIHNNLSDQGPELDVGGDTIKQGTLRQEEAKILYKYLIEQAEANNHYEKTKTVITLNKGLKSTVKNLNILNSSYILAGPFEIQKSGNGNYEFNGQVLDNSGKNISDYIITDEAGTQKDGIRSLGDVVGKGQFYIRVAKSNLTSNNIEGIKLYISYTTNDTEATFWTVNGSRVDQPVVVVDRTPKTDTQEISVNIPEFDLALRKYIVGVTRNGVNQDIDELIGRRPNIDKAPLNGNEETTAEYKHRKDPVPVETGDLVKYVITIYNEGDIAGRATKIVDYLPEGLEFSSADSTDFTFTPSPDKRTITITPKNVKNLPAYDGHTLSSVNIEFTCVVTKKEDKEAESTILTNIAEITEAYDENDVKMYLKDDDRDSEPNNLRKPTDTNLPNYKGNESNQEKLDDTTYHYEGQQDDDDFEKLIVTTPEFDLALRKFITHIDGEEVTPSREPVVDTTPLKTKSDTTAKYTHPKNPLVVGIGSTIRYTIRIYNECDVDGYVTVVEDYLPEELELVPLNESEINTQYQWVAAGRVVTTTYLNGQTIKAYQGGDELDYKDVEIECRVKPGADSGKILTNIAQINNDSGDDRDSTPSNVEKPSDTNLPNYERHQEDDDDYEKVITYQPGYDLALRKFITHINEEEVTPSREPVVDTTPLKNQKNTTAKYTHPKDPLVVNIGDKVTYTIRVYNEGDGDGIITVIEDYLPEELEFIPASESKINKQYKWVANGRVITTDYLDGEVIEGYKGGDELSYRDVEIECRIKPTENVGKILTNIAQINGDNVDDRDSTPSNVEKPSDKNLPNYEKHQEDDDDYEKVVIYKPEYDLSLRKFIVEINGEEPEVSREPVVDVTPLVEGTDTTAKYTHPKNPLVVKNGDIVVYTIRIYNEGEADAYAEEVRDNIPEGLEFVIDNDINIEYRWKLSEDEKQVTTDYLSKEVNEDNIIKAFDNTTMDTLDYKDVKIAFKVVEPNTSTRILTNIAEITDDDGNDRDSTPDNNEEGEDDIDEEKVQLRYFDLSLRKFITKVESKTGDNLPIETDSTTDVSREPKVEIDEDGKIKYVHPKDPVIVANSDIVIYTLRIYNEGTIDGYAEEIKDDIPAGLQLVPDHEINIKYGWVMYDKDGNVTDNVEEATTIRTTYLSEENDEDNIIKAFDRVEMETPDYKDVQVAFKVVEKNANSDRIIINTAQISEDSDDDIDSTPDNDIEDEDDIDKEYVKVKIFDLSLLKWVSKVMVTENGETKVTETGYNGTEDPLPVVKLEITNKQINSIIIKYEYGIRITNEGDIAGYATEITDYIPEGLEFIPEDNPLWTLEEDGKIVTRQLENVLLQPGESAVVTVVFKWINNENNFGLKENIAEISEDKNDKDAEDVDSTPDNKIPTEDDQDNALVLLNPKTGKMVVYVVLPTIILMVLATGVILIKKYVL